MALPLYKDLEKSQKDILEEDFDFKYVLKGKSSAPYGFAGTSTTEYKKGSLLGKLSLKGKYQNTSFDKLELKPDGKAVYEMSYNVQEFPGLKLEFKGDETPNANFTTTYQTKAFNTSAELDVVDFSYLKANAVSRFGPVTAGTATHLTLPSGKGKFEVKNLDVGVSIALPVNVVATVKSAKWFSEFTGVVAYEAAKNLSIASLFGFSPSKYLTSLCIGGLYKCNPSTTMKAKVTTNGVISASVKHSLDKTASAVATVEVDVANVSAYKTGFTVTLG